MIDDYNIKIHLAKCDTLRPTFDNNQVTVLDAILRASMSWLCSMLFWGFGFCYTKYCHKIYIIIYRKLHCYLKDICNSQINEIMILCNKIKIDTIMAMKLKQMISKHYDYFTFVIWQSLNQQTCCTTACEWFCMCLSGKWCSPLL